MNSSHNKGIFTSILFYYLALDGSGLDTDGKNANSLSNLTAMFSPGIVVLVLLHQWAISQELPMSRQGRVILPVP